MTDLFDYAAGVAAKQNGQEQVADNGPCFMDFASAAAKALSTQNGQVTIDDVRKHLPLTPHHPNAWGAIFRGPHWKAIGYAKSKLASNHARTIRIWRYQP